MRVLWFFAAAALLAADAAGQEPLRVRVDARIVDRETAGAAEVGATGQLLLPFPETSAGGAVYFKIDAGGTSSSRRAEQFVVVSSGGEASIAVGREIPYERWFLAYGERTGAVAKETEWREVGSRLSVRPTVADGGRTILLRVVPELEYVVNGRGRGRERRESVTFVSAATELAVESGREVRIAGSAESGEFYERFLVGYDRQRRVRAVDIFLKATVLDGVSP